MIPIRKHGGLLRADSNGFLARDASLKKITPPWLAAVEFVKAAFLKNLGDAVHSIYIRGSVPRGLAVEVISDIDTYFVVRGGSDACQQLDFSQLDGVRAEFSQKFQFAAGMERMCIHLENIIGADPDNFKWHFMIKVNSVCLYGEDLSLTIPPIKLDQIIGPKFSTLAKDIAFFNHQGDSRLNERLAKRGFLKQTNKTTLSILVPEAEKTIGTFRLKYAPSAALGMPAHVTVLHPFKLSTEISEELKDDLRAIISSHPIFNFSLSSIERFPNVLYLKPTPCRPLRELTKSIASHYPETPPYEGKIVDPIPHLTIAKSEDTHLLDHLFGEVSVALEGCMPIQATARQIWLLEQKGEVWQKHTVFSLRPT